VDEQKEQFIVDVLDPLKEIIFCLEGSKIRSLIKKSKTQKILNIRFTELCTSLFRLNAVYPEILLLCQEKQNKEYNQKESWKEIYTVAFSFVSRSSKRLISDKSFIKGARSLLNLLLLSLGKLVDGIVYENLLYELKLLETSIDAINPLEVKPNDMIELYYLLQLISKKYKSLESHCTLKIESQEFIKCLEVVDNYPELFLFSEFLSVISCSVDKFIKLIIQLSNVIKPKDS